MGVEHRVNLKPGAKPKVSKSGRLSQAEMAEVRVEIEGLLQQGLIEASSSPWSAPIVCARRKNGQLQLAMDYRALNTQKISNSVLPISLLEDLLDRMGNARIFSTLDLNSGYHQMLIREKDKELTAFVVP